MNIFRLFGLLFVISLAMQLTIDAIFGDGYYLKAKWPFLVAVDIFVLGWYFCTLNASSRRLFNLAITRFSWLGLKIAVSHSYADLHEETQSSSPGLMKLSDAKLKQLRSDIYSPWQWVAGVFRFIAGSHTEREHIANHLLLGDSSAAMVISIQPLIIAAYSVDMDCVVLMKCPDHLVEEYGLAIGSRLVTCNFYYLEWPFAKEIIYGRMDVLFENCIPEIADFLTDQQTRLQELKDNITDEEWARTWQLGQYAMQHYSHFRDGRPGMTFFTVKRS